MMKPTQNLTEGQLAIIAMVLAAQKELGLYPPYFPAALSFTWASFPARYTVLLFWTYRSQVSTMGRCRSGVAVSPQGEGRVKNSACRRTR